LSFQISHAEKRKKKVYFCAVCADLFGHNRVQSEETKENRNVGTHVLSLRNWRGAHNPSITTEEEEEDGAPL